MNQTSRTVHLELQHYIDAHMPVLIDALRAAPAPERAFRRAQAEAGMRFAAKIFGSEYAAQVARAVTIAGERRAPRG